MLTLNIHTRNDAFQHGLEADECARLLRRAADRLGSGEKEFTLLDRNGNKVGDCVLHQPGEYSYVLIATTGEGTTVSWTTAKRLAKRFGGDELQAWLGMCETIGAPGECIENVGLDSATIIFAGSTF